MQTSIRNKEYALTRSGSVVLALIPLEPEVMAEPHLTALVALEPQVSALVPLEPQVMGEPQVMVEPQVIPLMFVERYVP